MHYESNYYKEPVSIWSRAYKWVIWELHVVITLIQVDRSMVYTRKHMLENGVNKTEQKSFIYQKILKKWGMFHVEHSQNSKQKIWRGTIICECSARNNLGWHKNKKEHCKLSELWVTKKGSDTNDRVLKGRYINEHISQYKDELIQRIIYNVPRGTLWNRIWRRERTRGFQARANLPFSDNNILEARAINNQISLWAKQSELSNLESCSITEKQRKRNCTI